jgi:Family of unknown function (DUF6311)
MGRFVGALIGGLFFVWIAGTRALDPGEIGWLSHWDWPVHFFGWHFFRNEPWHWPPGLITSYNAPVGTSIGFTDSIPLVALALKPFSGWLPMPFQYIGPWLLACFTLQGWFGAWLVSQWTPRVSIQACAAALFVLMPTLLIRIGHPALCAHWLLLWVLVIAARDGASRVVMLEWALIGVIAGLMQPYLAVMVLGLLAAVAMTPAGVPLAIRGRALAASIVATLAAWWSWGVFSIVGGDSLSEGGLGLYSMNLLGPITPVRWSQFLPELPLATPAQDFEGFQYLGLGVLLLLPLAAVLSLRASPEAQPDRMARRWRGFGTFVFFAALAMALFSLSPRVTLGSGVLFDLSGPWANRLAVFRASGRFFWPLAYLLLGWALATLVARLPPRVVLTVMLTLIAVQAVDLHGAHEERRRGARDPDFYVWASPMTSPVWHQVLGAYDHLVLYPPPQCGNSPVGYDAPAYLAGLHGLTVNAGHLSRRDEGSRRRYCQTLADQMTAGLVDDDTLYIVQAAAAQGLRDRARPPVVCGEIDSLSVCVTADSYQRWRDLVTFH